MCSTTCSAQELAAEDMIKLPIVLAEHPEGWPAAVFGAVQTQRKLEAEALKDEAEGHGYVRPIVLFQAQNAGRRDAARGTAQLPHQ